MGDSAGLRALNPEERKEAEAEALEEALEAAQEADQEALEEMGETAQEPELDERQAKLRALRKKMQESSTANRKEVAQEANRRRTTAAESARLERKRKQAETFAEKLDAEETGTDLERKQAWQWTIEDNIAWDKKLAKKARRAQFEFTDYDDVARRKYKRDLDAFKPDLKSYNAQKAAALGYDTSDALIEGSSSTDVARANELLYRDANSFVYADHKPSEDALDRVVQKINMDVHKRNNFSRKRKEGNADVTYINESNKKFNKKLDRFFNKYTTEIRENFERGTAL